MAVTTSAPASPVYNAAARPRPLVSADTLRFGAYGAITIIVLTLTGVFASFARREVIKDLLTLASTFLYVSVFIAAYVTTMRARIKPGVLPAALNGAIAGALAGGGLALLTLFTTNVDVSFVFRNLGRLHPSPVTFGMETVEQGLMVLLLVTTGIGAVAGAATRLPVHRRNLIFPALILTTVSGVLQGQIDRIMTLPDALTITLTFAAAYLLIGRIAPERALWQRLLIGLAVGAVVALVMSVIVPSIGLQRGSLLRGEGSMPTILALANTGNVFGFTLILLGVGLAGALALRSPMTVHNGAWYFACVLVVLGLLNYTRGMTLFAALAIFLLIVAVTHILPPVGVRVKESFERLSRAGQTTTRGMSGMMILIVLLVLPLFAGQSISNTFNLVMLYVIMGIGLNVMIGYTGLLDLGYVASFAIGAYTAGILTSTGVMTFWGAWPIAILVSALTGVALGVPVLRLRGDYLAIVTLGFGEITNRILKSDTFREYFGGPQGVSPIPVPVINLSGIMPGLPIPATQISGIPLADFATSIRYPDPNWIFVLSRSTEIYYLYLFAVGVAAVVVLSLVNTRIGRAWRAVREDEDVAEAMGIHLVGTKLLAFGVSSAFAGLGGAIFGASLQGIFPDSFTLLVSINVLSIVIIGGMGSVPGIFLGAFVLVGMPEILRELQDYRLLVFGALLVVAMILKPEGLLPPQPARLAEERRRQAGIQPASAGATGD